MGERPDCLGNVTGLSPDPGEIPFSRVTFARTTWGFSSAGRALPWHGRGHGFEPRNLHQYFFVFTVYILQSTVVDKFYVVQV